MITKFFEANPELIEFFQAIKKKRFWMIQILNLLRLLQIIIVVFLLSYVGIVATGAFVTLPSLDLTLIQQREILAIFQEVILSVLIFHLIFKFFPFFFKKAEVEDDMLVSFCKRLFKITPLYLIGVGSINLLSAGLVVPSQAEVLLNEILNSFTVSVFLVLFLSLIMVEKTIRSIIKEKILEDSSIRDWLVLVTDQKVTSYDRSHFKLEFYHSSTIHTVDVRLKYSTQHFIFSEIFFENGGRVNQKGMNKLLSHLPQFDFEKLHVKLEEIKAIGEVGSDGE